MNEILEPHEIARTLSVIVPILNEHGELPKLVSHLNSIGAEQVIVIDGGSVDGGLQWLRQFWENHELGRIVLKSPAGRAIQMNVGAQISQGDLLLFLHADSRLPKGAKQEVLDARENQNLWGRFDIAFACSKKLRLAMQVISMFINIRSKLTSIVTGDQAMFVDHITFQKVGGFKNIPLMEDIAISKALKKHSVPHCSQLKVLTSARRWEQGGVIRTVLLMWYLRFAYFCGMSPKRLVQIYRQAR